MFVKLIFGKGFVVIDRVISLACPNFAGGIGDIVVHPAEGKLWTGEVHLAADTFRFHFGNVIGIHPHG